MNYDSPGQPPKYPVSEDLDAEQAKKVRHVKAQKTYEDNLKKHFKRIVLWLPEENVAEVRHLAEQLRHKHISKAR